MFNVQQLETWAQRTGNKTLIPLHMHILHKVERRLTIDYTPSKPLLLRANSQIVFNF